MKLAWARRLVTGYHVADGVSLPGGLSQFSRRTRGPGVRIDLQHRLAVRRAFSPLKCAGLRFALPFYITHNKKGPQGPFGSGKKRYSLLSLLFLLFPRP